MAVRKRYNSREIVVQLERETLEDFGETAFAMLRNLIFASPVGDPTLWQNPASAPPGYVGGHFRRNWVVSIGGFSDLVRPGVDTAGASTLAEGKRTIDRHTRTRRKGVKLVLQNNVPYANRLSLGHSTQASSGWVDRQVDAALIVPTGRRDLR